MQARNLKATGRFRRQKPKGPIELHPAHLADLQRCLDPQCHAPLPIRARGAGTAATDCNATSSGTTLRTTALNRITEIDPYNHTVTVECGVRLSTLVDALAEHGLELIGGYELQGRTVGGAVAAPCFGPGIGAKGSYFASHVIAMKIVTAGGHLLKIEPQQKKLLSVFRSSFGLLGVIYDVTLQVRPIQTFAVSHRRVSIDKFASIVDALSASDVGFKFYLMPYRDRVYLDLRRYNAHPGSAHKVPWKIKDWGESTVLPHVFRSLNRVVPIKSVKYRLIDSISEATQGLVNSRLVASGTNAASQSTHRTAHGAGAANYSTWCFPAANFSMIAKAYREFCETNYAESGYRCDMPAAGYRLAKDTTAPLSPSFDEAMIALTTSSTQSRGWDDFVIDLADFAEKWGGLPMISQSRALRAENVIQSYASRLEFFRRSRRKLDPHDRLLSPFLAQFAQ